MGPKMNRLSIVPRGETAAAKEAHWHSMRAGVITSTDMATLMDYNNYQSREKLWVLKKLRRVESQKDTPAMKWGRDREPIIAQAVAREKMWIVDPMPEFVMIPELRLGSSFDWKRFYGWGTCPFEIKTASPWVISRGYWHVTGSNLTYAGPRVELQLETQMWVANVPCCHIALETTDGRKYTGYREPKPLVRRMMVDKLGEWWKAFDKDVPLPGMKTSRIKFYENRLKLKAA